MVIRYATQITNEQTDSHGLSMAWGYRENVENLRLEDFYDKYLHQSLMDLPKNKLDKNYKLGTISAIREVIDFRPQAVSSTWVYFEGPDT